MISHSNSRPRPKTALALDMETGKALEMAKELSDFFDIAKIGLSLWAESGPSSVELFKNEGYKVFLDLKLHDIPHQVNLASLHLGKLGADYVTLHATGGKEMLQAGVEGLKQGAAEAGHNPPGALAVSMLTSDARVKKSLFKKRIVAAKEAACLGVVCSMAEAGWVKDMSGSLWRVVPGIRTAGDDPGDQKRTGTPREALMLGVEMIVLGRSITTAADPRDKASQVLRDFL